MIKQATDTFAVFIEQLKNRKTKRQMAWDALPEPQKQKIIAERERREKEHETRMRKKEAAALIKEWQRRGITKRYFGAEWSNWVADTPEKEIALNAAKVAWDTNLFFTGNNGTGKTHLAMCLAKDGAIYRRLPDIFHEVRMNFASEEETLNYYGGCRLFIIDEIGRQKFSPFEVNLFFDIIDRRWNNVLPTTLISNLTTEEFTELYGNAILDRLRPTITRFDWKSMRGERV